MGIDKTMQQRQLSPLSPTVLLKLIILLISVAIVLSDDTPVSFSSTAPSSSSFTTSSAHAHPSSTDGSAQSSVSPININHTRESLIQSFLLDMSKIQSLPMTKLTTPCHLISKDTSNTKPWRLEDWERREWVLVELSCDVNCIFHSNFALLFRLCIVN